MSKKNSNVILKTGFKEFKNLSKVYINFKNKLDQLKQKSFVLAISGGPDSLALAALAKAYNAEKKTKFYNVLVDHKIRKKSGEEAKEVKKLLKKHNLDLKILINKKKIDKNIQGQARNVRYEMLTNYCIKKKTRFIITGHNLEDQVETFFIRLSRGSGLTGLSSMQSLSVINRNIKLFRPLLDTKKTLLIEISKKIFGKYIKDPSNKDKKYLRTRIRKLKKPLIESGIKYDKIIRSINNLASSKVTLDQYIQETLNKILKKTDNAVMINLKKFHNLNKEIKIKAINESLRYLTNNYYNPRSVKVMNLIDKLSEEDYPKSTLGGCIISRDRDNLLFKKEKKK